MMHNTDLALLMDRFMRGIHSGLQQRAAEFDRKAVGQGGGVVLMTLAETGQISLNELTKRVSRDKSQMTRMIRSLEGKGLVRREGSPEDARVSLVCLTPEGEEVVAELMQAVAGVINEILTPISDKERQMLKTLLFKALG